MNFKKSKIRNTLKKVDKKSESENSGKIFPESSSSLEKPSNSIKPHHLKFLIFLSGLGILAILFLLLSSLIKSLDYNSFIFSFGKELQTDSLKKTNILLLGIGGEGHDGSNLTDTIMVASIDHENKKVQMLSLPRDLYIKDKKNGSGRINKFYDTYLNKYNPTQALEEMKETVGEITGTKIQYAIKVDFRGFVKIIDTLGGVNVVVEKDIYDAEYPKDGTILFEPFSLKAGPQQLDGKTALKYARSRHGNSGGDIGRAARQQQLLTAIKEKAFQLDLLNNSDKLQSLYSSLNKSLETDLSINEMIELAKLAKDLEKGAISNRVLNYDPAECGGFLYQPPREDFANAYVLLPMGNKYDQIQLMLDYYFNNNKFNTENSPIQVLNGTKTNGTALIALNYLSRYCLNTVYYGNAKTKDIETTTIYYKSNDKGEKPEALKLITTLIHAPTVEGIPPEYLENEKGANATIVIELGKDFSKIKQPDPFDMLMTRSPTKTEKENTQAGAQTKEEKTSSLNSTTNNN